MDAQQQVAGVAWAASRPAQEVDAFAVAKKLEAVRIQAERDGGLCERDALGSKAEAMRDQVTLAKSVLAREAIRHDAKGAA